MLGKIIYLRHCELTGKDKGVRLCFFFLAFYDFIPKCNCDYMNKGGKFLKKLRCCVLGEGGRVGRVVQDNLVLSTDNVH